ncbi:MAG: tRNA-dihydrouridine synthase [Candidatus Peribacteria bacterium]|nr:MAG: tRNA-dihydrouridine synthase [Candidatus Peribacteria bacterium]
MITIHGRTFSMGHSGENDRDYIQRFREAVSEQCLVIGNGGITHYDDMQGKHIDGYMVGQAAIGDPRIFTPHEPTPQDRYDIIMEHMHLLLAYEYWKEKNIPDTYEDPATLHNKTLLHARKKGGDIGDDTRHEVSELQLHDFVMMMPTMAELDDIANNLGNYVDFDREHQGLVEFRKYLFNYIAGLPESKELKKSLARTKEYHMMRREIDGFFSGMS